MSETDPAIGLVDAVRTISARVRRLPRKSEEAIHASWMVHRAAQLTKKGHLAEAHAVLLQLRETLDGLDAVASASAAATSGRPIPAATLGSAKRRAAGSAITKAHLAERARHLAPLVRALPRGTPEAARASGELRRVIQLIRGGRPREAHEVMVQLTSTLHAANAAAPKRSTLFHAAAAPTPTGGPTPPLAGTHLAARARELALRVRALPRGSPTVAHANGELRRVSRLLRGGQRAEAQGILVHLEATLNRPALPPPIAVAPPAVPVRAPPPAVEPLPTPPRPAPPLEAVREPGPTAGGRAGPRPSGQSTEPRAPVTAAPPSKLPTATIATNPAEMAPAPSVEAAPVWVDDTEAREVVIRRLLETRLERFEELGRTIEAEGVSFPTKQVRHKVSAALDAGHVAGASSVLDSAERAAEATDQKLVPMRGLLKRYDRLREVAIRLGVDIPAEADPRAILRSEPLSSGLVHRAHVAASGQVHSLKLEILRFGVSESRRLGTKIRAASQRGEDVTETTEAFRRLVRTLEAGAAIEVGDRLSELRAALARVPTAPAFPGQLSDEEREVVTDARQLARRVNRIKRNARDAQSAARLMGHLRAALSEDRRIRSPQEEVEELWEEVARLTGEHLAERGIARPGPGTPTTSESSARLSSRSPTVPPDVSGSGPTTATRSRGRRA